MRKKEPTTIVTDVQNTGSYASSLSSMESKKNEDNHYTSCSSDSSLNDSRKNRENSFSMQTQSIADMAHSNYSKESMVKKYIDEYDIGGRKERVLLIDVNCKNSSTGKIVYDLYTGLRDDGRSAAICYGRGSMINEESIYKFGLDWETIIHAAVARITGYNGCYSPLSTKRLIKYIDYYNPDLIHLHELHAYFVNIKPLIDYIKKRNIPVIWTFHCEYMYTGKCGHANKCNNYTHGCGNCPAVREYPKSLFFDKTQKMLEMKKSLLSDFDFTIITPSKWLADRVKTSFLGDKNIKVINNGVDTSIFHLLNVSDLRKNLHIPHEYRIVLAVAPNIMSEAKGGKWVLKLAEKMKADKVVFILVGGGAIPNKLPQNILYVGEIKDQNRLAAFYNLADVFVLLSKRETYSMTCAEALCCGTPVIGFKSGAPETVFTNEHASFVDYGDIDALAKNIHNKLFN